MTRSQRASVPLLLVALAFVAAGAHAATLIPMDLTQTDHLKAYGVAYWALEKSYRVEWLLNYRSGSFLVLDGGTDVAAECRYYGVVYEEPGGGDLAGIYRTIEEENMEVVLLEKAPAVALYAPGNIQPWDDAVLLALEYAEIPYTIIWDKEVLTGEEQKALYERLASEQGFPSVSEQKKTSARAIKEYVRRGGFLFAMCSGTDSYDIALAAEGIDIVAAPFDGTPPEPGAQEKLDFSRSLAFEGFSIIQNPLVYEFSDIDMTDVTKLRPEEIDYFTLFEFAAKHDPVPTMLTQCHVNVVKGFMGQTTTYRRSLVKKYVTVLADYPGSEEVKYIHGSLGRGTFTFLAGHDPEDYRHLVGDPPTILSLHRNSPGYRLILNNVLFPAAKKKERKT